jgi:threonine aldolase
MIDLRSDTVTKPTAAMREAMARAEVGDDVYGDDPTVRALEARTAEILGKDDAVYLPTGTMSNQVALRTHTESGDEILAEAGAHVFMNEGGAPAGLAGLLVRTISGDRGIFTPAALEASLRALHRFNPTTIAAPTKLVCVENTHNAGGGTVWPLEAVEAVAEVARRHGLRLHLDGARLWNAAAASGTPEADFAAPFDTVSVCFSKGLGAPVGSALAGPRPLMERARRFKQMFGGGFRQAGIVAAGALHALDNHRADLPNDHRRAATLAAGLSALPGVELDRATVETNIVRFRLRGVSAFAVAEQAHAHGVYLLPSGTSAMRAVVHRDIDDSAIQTALSVLKDVFTTKNKEITA